MLDSYPLYPDIGSDTLYLIVSTGAALGAAITTLGAAAGARTSISGSGSTNQGLDLAFLARGKGRNVCTTPGAVRAGVPHRKHRRIAREAEIHVPVATSTRPTVGCPSN